MLCVQNIACRKHSVYLASGRPHYEVASIMFLFSKLCMTVMGTSIAGRQNRAWLQGEQVVPCTAQGLQPVPSMLSLGVCELQIDVVLQINLNCK